MVLRRQHGNARQHGRDLRDVNYRGERRGFAGSILDLHIMNGDFPQLCKHCKRLPEGKGGEAHVDENGRCCGISLVVDA